MSTPDTPESVPLTRRQFTLGTLGAVGAIGGVGAGFLAGPPGVLRASDSTNRLRIAVIGCGGRGGANLSATAKEDIVGLCDTNADVLKSAARVFPKSKSYDDIRRVFDDEKSYDAVVVSTTEHTHAIAVMRALRAKKHVYCEKPLSHDVYEARQIRLEARKAKVTTQMGIQIHATENYRRVVELIQGNVIGPVTEVHVWVSRAWGLQDKQSAERNRDIVHVDERPKGSSPVPKWLNWDLWLGQAPERPFHEIYLPGPKWYRWWDFGNGTMSDLGSHWNDLPFWALKLTAPTSIEAAGPKPHAEIAPATMSATYEFPKRGELPAVRMTWYQGEMKPKIWTDKGIPQWGDGVLFVGEKGMLLSNYGKHVLLPEEKFREAKLPDKSIPRVSGHQQEWIEACKAGLPASADFEYSGLLTESNHLGNVAFRVGKKLLWDTDKLEVTNAPEAAPLIRCPYRKGWEL